MTAVMAAPVRFALIGCGRMGRHHSEKLIADGRGIVTVLFDAMPAMANGLQRELWPSATVVTTFEQLLSCDEVDAAIICTPTAEHAAQASACLDRGWHVLCEKPLASDRRQILSLMEKSAECRQRNQAFTLGYQRRYAAIFRTFRREILSGRWGRVRAILSNNVENWQSTIGGTWRDDPHQNPGGFVTDAGSHKIDALFYLSGLRPVEAFAHSQKWGSQVEIVTSVSALLSEDVLATMNFVGHAQYLGEDLHIHCEYSDLMLRHEQLWIARHGKMELMKVDEPESNPVTGILDMVLDGAPDISPPESALPVYDLTQAILKSSIQGIAVPVGSP